MLSLLPYFTVFQRLNPLHDKAVPIRSEAPAVGDEIERLLAFLNASRHLAVLTGAGISTASGIPGYRDADGNWQRKPPVTHQEFIGDEAVRKRYWARSMLGWPMLRDARPNAAHAALARLEQRGRMAHLITQNVDGLHAAAGSMNVVELHGRLREVKCMDCNAAHARDWLQASLVAANPGFLAASATVAPDGDVELEANFNDFKVAPCTACGGMLKPDVVFYGDSVPLARARAALAAVEAADALLIVGSTVMVRSGYRLCEAAHAAGKPIAAINLGRTRADPLLSLKVQIDCGTALAGLADSLCSA